jgi:hypothetical protein
MLCATEKGKVSARLTVAPHAGVRGSVRTRLERPGVGLTRA